MLCATCATCYAQRLPEDDGRGSHVHIDVRDRLLVRADLPTTRRAPCQRRVCGVVHDLVTRERGKGFARRYGHE